VMDWKPPKSVHQIHSFLGLAGYYRRFIPDFSTIAKPVTEKLKKGVKFVWSKACEKAFHTLRQHLTSASVLVQPDNSKPFEVFCGASGMGLGCVLMQEGRVIAYASRALCVVWTFLGPLPQWVPGLTTRWAPGTTRLALHGT
jgi:hypothetical protein